MILVPNTSGTLRLKNKKTITRNHLQDEKQQKYDDKN